MGKGRKKKKKGGGGREKGWGGTMDDDFQTTDHSLFTFFFSICALTKVGSLGIGCVNKVGRMVRFILIKHTQYLFFFNQTYSFFKIMIKFTDLLSH